MRRRVPYDDSATIRAMVHESWRQEVQWMSQRRDHRYRAADRRKRARTPGLTNRATRNWPPRNKSRAASPATQPRPGAIVRGCSTQPWKVTTRS